MQGIFGRDPFSKSALMYRYGKRDVLTNSGFEEVMTLARQAKNGKYLSILGPVIGLKKTPRPTRLNRAGPQTPEQKLQDRVAAKINALRMHVQPEDTDSGWD